MGKIQTLVKAATKAAQKSNAPIYKVGAAAYRNGRIIKTGWNDFKKTDPRARNNTKKRHAEFVLGKDLRRATVLVVRITASGRLAMARPCKDCEKLLQDAKLILYSDSKGEIQIL